MEINCWSSQMFRTQAVQLDNFMTQHYSDSLTAIDQVGCSQTRNLRLSHFSHYRNMGAITARVPHRISMMQLPHPFQFSFSGYEVHSA
jgi:hypothetical protein